MWYLIVSIPDLCNLTYFGTFGVVLYRNDLLILFYFAELHISSSIRYENALYGNNFLNCYIVKLILISFNSFPENIING